MTAHNVPSWATPTVEQLWCVLPMLPNLYCTVCGGSISRDPDTGAFRAPVVVLDGTDELWPSRFNGHAHAGCCDTCASCDVDMPDVCTRRVTGRYGTTLDYCARCFDANDAWTCEHCGFVFDGDVSACDVGAYGALCPCCANTVRDDMRDDVIGAYHNSARRANTRHRVSTWTRAHGNRMFGVELELERYTASRIVMDLHDSAADMLHAAHGDATGCDRLLFAERDGSLRDGFELISQPMGLDMHRTMWQRVLSCDAMAGMRSHDTTTCGLHVHVSRAGLSRLTLTKAVCFLNAPENEFLVRAVARRYNTHYCLKKTTRLGTALRSPDRYEMLNLTNSRTVEFRLFRGTTRHETLMACVEFAHAVLEWAARASCTDLSAASFLRHVYAQEHMPNTRHLRAYFARRTTERLSPARVGLRDLITTVTGTAPVRPAPADTHTPFAEV